MGIAFGAHADRPQLDLSKITEDTVIADGTEVFEEAPGKYKISIADGATVYFNGVTIQSSKTGPGITCIGDATIMLING